MTSSSFGGLTPEVVVDLLLRTFVGSEEPTVAAVEGKVAEFLTGPFASLSPQREVIVEEVMRRIRVRVGAASTLDEHGSDHVPWLPDVKRDGWRFWPRLQDYLHRVDRLPPAVLQELDRSSDQALERLESPLRSGRWDRRGLVVGHVQSGKTTHYTALTAKALDAGYEIVIILAGIHNSLRSQTHERIDKYLLGRDSAALVEALRDHGDTDVSVKLIGVGEEDRLLGRPALTFSVITCTSSAEDGDFRTQVANKVWVQVSHGTRLVMVVKKNATILRNLIAWLQTQNTAGAPGSAARIQAPTLVIDDEADHASMNTSRDPDDDPTTINRRIRELLMSFDRVGFVGYTATPFANIFVDVDSVHPQYGADLFPRSFILNLKAPTDYVGPALVFGHPGDESTGIPEQLPLPMHVPVDDAAAWLPDKHKKTQTPGPIPASLIEATRVFVLVCAARACRGDANVHNSMLVHATRFVNVQDRVAEQLETQLTALKNIIGSGSGANIKSLASAFEEIWRRRMLEPHENFKDRLGDRCAGLPAWEQVWQAVPGAVEKLKVMRVNGASSDALAYTRNPKGISVIAVGGDKLSRGLTLEGLSVSYFLRTSNMFDTLMQMGRWFGYRPRYADLCRVYTTPMLYQAFRQIALAMDDLRADLDRMADAGKTPRDFGLRVRTPSDGLLITAANKIRRGEDVLVRFANSLVQTLETPRTGARAESNRMAAKDFVASLGKPETMVRGAPSSHFLWAGVSVARVLDFLASYEAYATPSFYNHCDALRRYVGEQAAKGELATWTVALISKKDSSQPVPIGGRDYQMVRRGVDGEWGGERYRTRGIVGTSDEAVDLTTAEYTKALAESPPDPKRPGGRPQMAARDAVRCNRPPTRGLLLLYLIRDESPGVDSLAFIPAVAISFPESATAAPLAYTVNEVWRHQYGLIEEVAEDGNAV